MPNKFIVALAFGAVTFAGLQTSLAQNGINGERSNQQQGESSEIKPNGNTGLPTTGNSRMEDIRRSANGKLTFSPAERSRIQQAVAHSRLKRQQNVAFTISVGAAVPQQADARDLPPALAKAVPSKHPLQYVLVRDQLILLDKRTRRIVAIVPGVA